ncbi:RNA polymerase II transcription elongation factor-domain-containing protein [Schizophyllum commune]
MSLETPWLPASGRHSVSVGNSLAKALQARKNRTGPPPPSKFDKFWYSVRYNHKPSSIDTSKAGHVVRHSENRDFPVTLQQPSKDGKTLEWQGQEANPAEWTCVLIYDSTTQSYILEKVESSLSMTYVRRTEAGDAAPDPTPSDDLAGALEDALREQESSEEGEIPLHEIHSPKGKAKQAKPKPKPFTKPKLPQPAPETPSTSTASSSSAKGKLKRESPPPSRNEPPASAARPAKRARPSPPPVKRKPQPVPQKKAPPEPAELMFPTANNAITLPGANGHVPTPPPVSMHMPREPSPVATPTMDLTGGQDSDEGEDDWEEVASPQLAQEPAAPVDFLGLEMEEIDGNDMPGGEVDNDLERELENELGGGDAGDGEDDEEDDDMVDVFEEELHKQLDDGLGSQDMVGADEYQEDDDFLAQSMEPPPPPSNGAPKSLQELAGAGSFEYEDDSSSSDEDDDE